MSVGYSQRLNSITRFEDLVPQSFKRLDRQAAQGGFIFHQKNGFASPMYRNNRLCGGHTEGFFDGRKINLERGPQSDLAVNRDMPAALLHDAIHRGQT